MRFICYERVSTEGQAGPNRHSLSTQREICHQKALELGATEIEHLQDTYTGTALSRPAMNRLRDRIRHRAADAILFFDVDRIGRDALDILIVHREIQAAGIEMHLALGDWQNTPGGKLLLQIRAALSEHEHAQILERTTRGKNKKAAAGQIRTFIRLYGYRFVKGEARLSVDPTERGVVRQVFAWCARDGLGSVEIARRLAARGIPAPRAGMKRRDGIVSGVWHREQVWAMLHNATYADGIIRRKDERADWAPLRVEPIVPPELWAGAQRVCAARRSSRGRGSAPAAFLLQAILECGHCRRGMTTRTVSGRWAYYYCPNHYRHAFDPATRQAPARCPQMPIRAAVADEAVWATLRQAPADPAAHLRELAAAARDDADTAAGRLADARRRIRQAEGALARAHEAWVAGYMGVGPYERQVGEWRGRLEEARGDQAVLEHAAAAAPRDRGGLERLAAAIAGVEPSFAERRLLVRALCRRVILTDRRLRVEGWLRLAPAEGSFEKKAMRKIGRELEQERESEG